MTVLSTDFMSKKVHEVGAAYDRVLARAATWRAERLAATTKLMQQDEAYRARLEAEPDSDAAARATWRGELGLAALEQEIRDLDSLLQKHPAAQAKALAAWQQAQAAEAIAFYERTDPMVRSTIEEMLEKVPLARWEPLLERLRPIAGLSLRWAAAEKSIPGYRQPDNVIPLPVWLGSPILFCCFLSIRFPDRIGAPPAFFQGVNGVSR